MNLVSIIVPIYNAENTLHRCIKSIVNQTYRNLEIILINDGSNDASSNIIAKYANSDSRIVYICQKNKGVSATRNVGLDKASGDYILYIDSDDWIELNMVETMINHFDNEIDIVFCGHDNLESIDQINQKISSDVDFWDKNKQLKEFLIHKKMTGMLWNKLIKKELFKNIVFDETVGYGEDAQILWKILKKSRNMCVISDVLYHHIIDKNSISHQSFSSNKYSAIKVWKEIEKDVEKNYPQWIFFAKERLISVAIYSFFEMKRSKYNNIVCADELKSIVRNNILIVLKSNNISFKMKLYGLFVFVGI